VKKGFSPVVPLRICGAVLGFLFPFLVYLGIRKDATLTVTLLILGMAVIHFAGIAGKPEKHQITGRYHRILVFVAVLIMAGFFWWSGDFAVVKMYPLLITGSFFAVFAGSLLPGRTPVIELFASITVKKEERDDFFRKYCRKVTHVWCVFFIINGSISAYTAVCCSDETWILYNGMISYILLGMMFGGEYAVRVILRRIRKKSEEKL